MHDDYINSLEAQNVIYQAKLFLPYFSVISTLWIPKNLNKATHNLANWPSYSYVEGFIHNYVLPK